MNCQEARELVNAYADDELDLVNVRALDVHLSGCVACSRKLESIRALKAAAVAPSLYAPAPTDLRSRVMQSVRAVEPRREPFTFRRLALWRAVAVAASLMLVFAMTWGVLGRRSGSDLDAREVLAAHLRSMQNDQGHLIDIRSTDQHTVKPWLDARLDFAPPVKKLDDQGYVLEGGRLDYLHDRAVAAIVYHHRQHIINLFIWPGDDGHGSQVRQGFNLVEWSDGGMTFWAVSDLNLTELQEFAALLRAGPSATHP